MKRRKFMRSALTAVPALAGLKVAGMTGQKQEMALIEMREYELHFGTDQNILHEYFQKALIPALNRLGVAHVGVFKEWSRSEPAKIYCLFSYPSVPDLDRVRKQLRSDEKYLADATIYLKTSPEHFPFTRFKTKLMAAFVGFPNLVAESSLQNPRIFELRTYEGYNEDANSRKVAMFNKEEFPIFSRNKLNPVFFGEVLAGDQMPCLTYMLVFENMEERDRNWAAFGNDPDWKRVSAAPEYANTVSKITKIFLEPMGYSQI